MQSHIEAIAGDIVSTAVNIEETERTLFGELSHGIEGCHTEHRNLHLDCSASHN